MKYKRLLALIIITITLIIITITFRTPTVEDRAEEAVGIEQLNE